jgi:hypothetical protein
LLIRYPEEPITTFGSTRFLSCSRSVGDRIVVQAVSRDVLRQGKCLPRDYPGRRYTWQSNKWALGAAAASDAEAEHHFPELPLRMFPCDFLFYAAGI